MIEPLPTQPLRVASGLADLDAWVCALARPRREIDDCERVLSDDERRRAARFGRPELRDRYIVGRATLRALLGERLAVGAEEVVIARGHRGRPFIPGADGIDFNVSHTDETALIGIARGPRIGVDIEHGDRQVNVEGVARKFMSAREQAHLASLSADGRRRALLRLWTCKEAMSKATGDALSAPFRKLDVVLGAVPCLADGPTPYEPPQWQLVALDVPGGYLATVAIWHRQDRPPPL